MHISLSLYLSFSLSLSNSARALEVCHSCQNCTTFQGVRERYFGSHHWKILQEFQCVCWASGVWNQQRRTLLDGRPISECGWKTCVLIQGGVGGSFYFVDLFICTKCNWHTMYSPFPPMLQGYIWSMFKCVKLCDSAKFLTFAFLTLLMLMFVFKFYARKKKC